MSAGFQAWDSAGRLVVDLGDYSCRLHTVLNVNYGAGAGTGQIYRVGVSGVTGNNHFACISNTSDNTRFGHETPLFVKTFDGGIDIFCLYGAMSGSITLQIDIYVFI